MNPHTDSLPLPDYSGAGIVNLMASLINARGGLATAPEATLLPAHALAGARQIVLLVIDGLGDDWLLRHAPRGLLAGARRGALTSVFPPTTAAAITTFLTGEAPAQHGLTGWFMWLKELGAVLTVLPGCPRYGGVSYRAAGIDVAALFGHQPLSARLATPSTLISPREIAHSDFNLAHQGPARLRQFRNLRGLMREIRRAVRGARAPGFVYAYWPELDHLGHVHGIDAPQTLAHLAELEAQLAGLVSALAGTDTVLLVCADHGLVDLAPADITDLRAHPVLADCLRIPLCGEPRAAFCYVRPDRVGVFEDYCRERLAGRFALHRSADLIDAGWFGPGPHHPRLHERIGDSTLVALGGNAIRDPLPSDGPFRQVGVHGGLSRAELYVPLCQWRC